MTKRIMKKQKLAPVNHSKPRTSVNGHPKKPIANKKLSSVRSKPRLRERSGFAPAAHNSTIGQTFNDGYQAGFAEGFEAGHQLSYEQASM